MTDKQRLEQAIIDLSVTIESLQKDIRDLKETNSDLLGKLRLIYDKLASL